MKSITIIVSVVLLCSFCVKPAGFNIKEVQKTFVKVKDDLYVCKYEVTNQAYRNFLTDLQENNKEALYHNSLPDTVCWRDKLTYNEPFVEYYFRYPSFNNYPVVGVSYEAAQNYCNWLTERYNADAKRKFKTVRFRLLSKEEWIFAANKGDNNKVYTWGSGFMQNNRKQFLCNFRHLEFEDSVSKGNQDVQATLRKSNRSAIAGDVNSFYPNSFGIYNMCGNVAEMISEKGIAKGGGYNDPAYAVRISSEKTYANPAADIGFRVAMQVIEE